MTKESLKKICIDLQVLKFCASFLSYTFSCVQVCTVLLQNTHTHTHTHTHTRHYPLELQRRALSHKDKAGVPCMNTYDSCLYSTFGGTVQFLRKCQPLRFFGLSQRVNDTNQMHTHPVNYEMWRVGDFHMPLESGVCVWFLFRL